MSETTPETSDLRERLAEALRTCRVDDDAPVRLLNESDVFHVSHMLLPVVAQEIAAAEQRGREEVRARVEEVHPLIWHRRCGARLADPIDPPPGPPSPPEWCALGDDGHSRHRTYDGRWLDLFHLPIEEREPITSYRCVGCNGSGKTPEEACPTRAALVEPAPEEHP